MKRSQPVVFSDGQSPPPPAAARQWMIVAFVLCIAAVARLIAAYLLPDQSALMKDVAIFRESAQQLFSNFEMESLYHMPLYPAFIGVFGRGQLAADIALSLVSVWLVYALSLELFSDRLAALFTAIAAALYPPLSFFAVLGMSETLFTTLVLAAFLCWYRAQFALAAVFAVLAILTRPIFDLAAPLLIILFAVLVHRLSLAQTARHCFVYAIIYGALMSPWWLHNYYKYGEFVRLTAGFGTILYAGNNPLNKFGGSNLVIDYEITEFQKIADPIARDRALRNAAIEYIRDHPRRFAELAVIKFIRIWRAWPAHEEHWKPWMSWVLLVTFLPVLLLSALGLFYSRHRLRRLSPILLFGLGYTATHMILAGSLRYRLPLEPFLLIFSGAAASELFQRYAPGLGINATAMQKAL